MMINLPNGVQWICAGNVWVSNLGFRRCGYCHRFFLCRHRNQKFCKPMCSVRSRVPPVAREMRTCARCRRLFNTTQGSLRQHCSDLCYNRDFRLKNPKDKPRSEVNCPQCGVLFPRRRTNHKYCTARCGKAAFEKRHPCYKKQWHATHPGRRGMRGNKFAQILEMGAAA